MSVAAYYVPTFPERSGFAHYNHAQAITSESERSILLSNNEIPEDIKRGSDECYVVDGKSPLAKARSAFDHISRLPVTDTTVITSFHYEAAAAGWLSSRQGYHWVVDLNDPPIQYRLNNPRTHHQVTSRVLERLVDRAHHGIHASSPDTPHCYGQKQSYLPNGTPAASISPSYSSRDEIEMVFVGSPRAERGGKLLIDSLDALQEPPVVDIYGNIDEEMFNIISKSSVEENIRLHGRVKHETALQAVRNADVGYCVLPPRSDWKYATNIKVGEYLAGGTIPIISDYPGMRYLAKDSGVYTQPSKHDIAKSIKEVQNMSSEDRKDLARHARERAEEVSWERIRKKFAEYALS